MSDLKHHNAALRHDFVILFDITDGNPNGDPDAGNMPRTDPETQHGIVTDVCIKRKIRNYVDEIKGDEQRNKIFVQNRGYLVDHKRRAYEALGISQGDDSRVDEARQWMCNNFYDVRMFGGVLVGKKSSGKKEAVEDTDSQEGSAKKAKKKASKEEEGGYNCGQVRGPVQLSFARSIDPVLCLDLTITRVALENSGEKKRDEDDSEAPTGTFGRKPMIPYGLYRAYGFYNPYLAERTGFNGDDLALLWNSLEMMWRFDTSAARQQMYLKGLHVFSHDSKCGNASADSLFKLIEISRNNFNEPPRSFGDYIVTPPPTGPLKDFPGVTYNCLV